MYLEDLLTQAARRIDPLREKAANRRDCGSDDQSRGWGPA
jgi:hypothetical protein